jgi:hypothetical protein
MGEGSDSVDQSPRELASRLDDGLKSCQNVVEQYRGLLRKRRHKAKSSD